MGRKSSRQTFRVGIVNVTPAETPGGVSIWLLEYTCPGAYPGDPETGRRVRRRVRQDEMDREAVEELAEHLTRQAYQGKGYLAATPAPKAPPVADGIAQALLASSTLPKTLKERIRQANKFTAWLAKNHPAAKTWDDMRPAMLQGYAGELEKQGLAFDSIRLAIEPVRLAWRFMAENYPEAVRPLPRVRIGAERPRRIECLPAAGVSLLLAWLKANRPDLYGMAALQALAGLQMMEAAAVRHQDLDMDAGTVRIVDTPTHRLKNRFRERTLPLCREALEAVGVAVERQARAKVRPAGGELFQTRAGNPWNLNALQARWRRAHAAMLAEAEKNAEDDQAALDATREVVRLPPRKLRAAFATMAGRLGAVDRHVKRYLGHAPEDILGRHYQDVTPEQLDAVARKMDGWRELISQDLAKSKTTASAED